MNPDTGEIKEVTKLTPVPENWIGLPEPGEEIEIVTAPANKRGRRWVVKEIIPGNPGKMIVEPKPETVGKCRV